MKKIVLYGSSGQIGSILRDHWDDRCHPVEVQDVFDIDDADFEIEAVVWCATIGVENYQNLYKMDKLFEEFKKCLFHLNDKNCPKFIYTSSFGLENYPEDTAIDGYVLTKMAGEVYTRAWSMENKASSAVSLRMGGYGPITPKGSWYEMDDAQICRAYDAALNFPVGYNLLKPVVNRI